VAKSPSRNRQRVSTFTSIALGVGLNFLLPGAGTSVWATMGNAAISSTASQGSSSLIMNKGNFKSVKDLSSLNSLKSLAITVGSAGITQGILNTLGLPMTTQVLQGTKGRPLSLEDVAKITQIKGIENSVCGGLTIVIQGEKPREALKEVTIGTATGTVGAVGAYSIGEMRTPGMSGNITHKVEHFVLGAGLTKIQGGNLLVGGVSAVGAEGLMEVLPWRPEINAGVAQLAASSGALLIHQDPSTAFFTAKNAVEHNDLLHPYPTLKQEQNQIENLQYAGENVQQAAEILAKLAATGIPLTPELCNQLRAYLAQSEAVQRDMAALFCADPDLHPSGSGMGRLMIGLIPETYGGAALSLIPVAGFVKSTAIVSLKYAIEMIKKGEIQCLLS
jgi:putative hemagglutinin DUF637